MCSDERMWHDDLRHKNDLSGPRPTASSCYVAMRARVLGRSVKRLRVFTKRRLELLQRIPFLS